MAANSNRFKHTVKDILNRTNVDYTIVRALGKVDEHLTGGSAATPNTPIACPNCGGETRSYSSCSMCYSCGHKICHE